MTSALIARITSLFTVIAASTLVSAAPVLHNLTFSGGTFTPSGSFQYDAASANNPFSSSKSRRAGSSLTSQG